MDADGQHQSIGKPYGLADNVEMAVGDRIERSGEESNPHDGGLARVQTRCKMACEGCLAM